MMSHDVEHRFGILREIYRLAKEQHAALQAEDMALFEERLGQRETLLEQLVALEDSEWPENVIPLRATSVRERKDSETAIRVLLQGILEQDARNEELIRTRMSSVQDAIRQVGRGASATEAYRAGVSSPQAVDRAI